MPPVVTPDNPLPRSARLSPLRLLAVVLVLCSAAVAASKLGPAPSRTDPTPPFRPDPERSGSFLVRPDVQPALRVYVAERACRPSAGTPPDAGCVARIAVPAHAVHGAPDAPRLVVITSPASIEPRPVRVGEAFDSLVEILEGLDAGERVVLLSDGLPALP